MNKAKINSLYEQAHVIYETPYESSVVDPTIMSIHKHKVWDRYLFAELIVRECIGCCEQVISDPVPESVDTWLNGGEQCIQEIQAHFGVEEK